MAEAHDIYKWIENLFSGPKPPSVIIQFIEQSLDAIDGWKEVLEQAKKRKGCETWLHTAIKYLNFQTKEEKKLVKLLTDKYPKLILEDRYGTDYAGQTPLHMGVCKGNIWSVKHMLKCLSVQKNKHLKIPVLRRKAIGSIFDNTAMMAELPLFVAALTFNKEMFDLLLEHGAEIDAINSRRNTVCHSLIRYAYCYPDKLENVLDMLKYINEGPTPAYCDKQEGIVHRKLRKKIWLMENRDLLNPLQYAAKFGQHRIFELIMNMEAYCFDNNKDGLFDIKIYDITEIDPIAYMSRKELTGYDRKQPNSSLDLAEIPAKKLETDPTLQRSSIIMTLLDLDPLCAFHFIMFPAVRMVIDKKWKHYQKYFYPWWVLHFLFMCLLTWYGVEKSLQSNNRVVDPSTSTLTYTHGSPDFTNRIPSDPFVTSCGVISVFVGVLYIAQDVTRILIGRMLCSASSFTNPYSNGIFRVMFMIFGLALILDFCVSWARKYENYLLIVAILLGWYLVIFFLRGMRRFSFFTVLIQRVLIDDMFRFFVILAIELVAFSTAMYMIIQGSNLSDESEFSNFGRILFAMLKLMVGLGEIDSIYSVRHPALAIILFVAFIVMTTLLMMNALIAMMSRTCSELVDNIPGFSIRDMHWKLQRLSLVLFIESILPSCLIWRSGEEQKVLRYDNETHRRTDMTRYMMEIRSLQKDDQAGPEPFESSWVFNVLSRINVSDAPKKPVTTSGGSKSTKGRKKKRSDKELPPKNPAAPKKSEMTPVEDVNMEYVIPAPPPTNDQSEPIPINQHTLPEETRKVLDIYNVELRRGRHDTF